MSIPALLWLGVALGSVCFLSVLVVALARQGAIVARTAARLAREAAEISAATERARSRR